MKHKHMGVYAIDYYAYLSKLLYWNPCFKVVLAVVTLVICIVADRILLSVFVMVSMGYLTIVKGGLDWRHYLTLLAIPLAFMITGGVAIAIGISREPAGRYWVNLHWFYLYVSDGGMWKALQVTARAMGAVSAMYMMVLSTPAGEIISVLRVLKIPKLVIELMNMIYRFIFIIMDTQLRMMNSAQSRLGYVDFKTACHTFGSTAGNLLVVSFKRANLYYDALLSRCYDGDLLFLEEEKMWRKAQVLGAFLYVSVLILLWVFLI